MSLMECGAMDYRWNDAFFIHAHIIRNYDNFLVRDKILRMGKSKTPIK